MEEVEKSENSGVQVLEMSNSANSQNKSDSNRLVMPKFYTQKMIRELVFMIKMKSKGKLSFSEISKRCGFDKSRLNQILGNFKKYFPKKKKFQDQIWKKLNEQLESLNWVTGEKSD